MTGNVRVVEDGADQRSSARPPGGPSWGWLVVGLAVGLGLAVVFSLAGSGEPDEVASPVTAADPGPPQDGDPESPVTEPISPEVVGPGESGEPEGVGEIIEGFPDTLVAVTQVTGGNLALITWPVSGPPIESSLPGFAASAVEFDQSGRLVAMGTPVADSGGMLLSFGPPQRVQPFASNVHGFAWHDSEPLTLAYTQIIEGEWRLSVVDRSREARLVDTAAGVEGVVVAWGAWGFAIQSEEEVTLLTGTGEIVRSFDGRLLDTDAEGRIVLYDGTLSVLDPTGLPYEPETDSSLIGPVWSALISPDATKLAVVGESGHLIVSLDGSAETTYGPATPGFGQMVWSSDSRFLVAPWFRGVFFIDTQSNSEPLVELTRQTVVAVTSIPLSQG